MSILLRGFALKRCSARLIFAITTNSGIPRDAGPVKAFNDEGLPLDFVRYKQLDGKVDDWSALTRPRYVIRL
jgi:hypothetical protein